MLTSLQNKNGKCLRRVCLGQTWNFCKHISLSLPHTFFGFIASILAPFRLISTHQPTESFKSTKRLCHFCAQNSAEALQQLQSGRRSHHSALHGPTWLAPIFLPTSAVLHLASLTWSNHARPLRVSSFTVNSVWKAHSHGSSPYLLQTQIYLFSEVDHDHSI